MSNINNLSTGHLDRITGQLFNDQMFQGTGPLGDELRARAAATCRNACDDEAAQIVRERDATIIKTHELLWQANEAFAILAKALPKDDRVAALFEVLDDALKAYEVLAGEVLA